MERKMIIAATVILAVLSTVNAVSAGATLSLDDITKNVPVGGTVDFTVTLQSSITGPGVISWRIANTDPIKAKLESKPLSKFGFIVVNTPPKTQKFTLTVAAEDGAVIGQEYPVELNYCAAGIGGNSCAGNVAIARAEAGVIPTPELSTSILTATGLIGLIGLVRMRRKD